MQRGTIHPATRTMHWKVNKKMNNVTKNLNHQVRLAGFAWGAEMLATREGCVQDMLVLGGLPRDSVLTLLKGVKRS